MRRLVSGSLFALALLALLIGRASALSVTMAPPQGVVGPQIVQCPSVANIVAGTNGLWTITDSQCVRSQLSNGWTIVQTAQVLTPAANVVMDLSKGCSASIAFPVAGQNVTLTATNIPYCTGKDVIVYTTQPASGTTTNTLTFSTGFTANAAFPVVKTGTSATDAVAFSDNGTALMYPLVGSAFGNGGVQIFTIGWDGDLGTLTNAAVKSQVAPCTGHFTSLSCVATLTGTCTTPPTVNVTDVTGSTTGTASVLTTTVGTPVVHAQTLVFTSGDTIGLAQTATPGTCTVPRFGCQATATCP